MKIESVNPLKNLPETVNVEQNIPALKKGDTVKAEVLVHYGENITLKSADGKVFSAKLISDLLLSGGDRVELFVQGKSASKLVLKVLSVESGRHKPAPADALLKNLTAQYGEKAGEVLESLYRLNIKPTPDRLNSIFGLLKQNPSLDAKAAVFLSVNGFAGTPENTRIASAILSGDADIGAQLIALMHDIAGEAEAKGAPLTEAAQKEAETDGAQSAGGKAGQTAPKDTGAAGKTATEVKAFVPGAGADAQGSGIAQKNAAADKSAAGPGTPGQEMMPGMTNKEAVTASPGPANAPGADGPRAPEAGAAPKAAKQAGEAAPAGKDTPYIPENAGKSAAGERQASGVLDGRKTQLPEIPGNAPEQKFGAMDIVKKILTVFTCINGAEDSEKIKKSAAHTLGKITELKEMLKNSDIKGKENYALKLDETLLQLKFTADIDRVYCMQVPLQQNGATGTAEIFIYKRKKRGGKVDAENTVLLIGLDTINLGRVETVVRIENRNVTLVFKLNHEEAMQAIRRKASSLHKGFKELGYNLADTQVAKLKKRTTAAEAEEELNIAACKTPVYLDYRI